MSSIANTAASIAPRMFSRSSATVSILGDIIVAADVARAQTAQFGTTPAQELCVLLVHGLLHLCGWDHVNSDEEAEAMEARERELLEGLGMPGIR